MPNFIGDGPADELERFTDEFPRHCLKLASWLGWALRPAWQRFQQAGQEAALRAAVERMQSAAREPDTPTPPPPSPAIAQPILTKPPKRPGITPPNS